LLLGHHVLFGSHILTKYRAGRHENTTNHMMISTQLTITQGWLRACLHQLNCAMRVQEYKIFVEISIIFYYLL
jgi:hypothetical protein